MRPSDQFDTPRPGTDPRYAAETMAAPAMLDEEAPAELRADIAETRAELDATVDAIQERLSPEYLKAQAKDVVHDAADQARAIIHDATEQAKEIVHEAVQDATAQAKGAVHDATVGKAEEAVSGAARGARGAGSTMIETIKQNPFPAALVGIGLGWMFFKRQNSASGARMSPPAYRGWTGDGAFRGNQRLGQPAPPYGAQGYDGYRETRRHPDQGSAAETVGRVRDGAGQMAGRVQDGAGQFVDRVQDSAGQMAGRVQGTTGQLVDQAQNMVGQIAGQAQETAGQVVETVQERTQRVSGTAQGQFQRLLRESPLTLGGVALAAGLAAGLAIPATNKEDELLGEARDSLMQQARETAQDAQERLQQVAQEAGRAAQDEAKEQRLTT